MIVSIICFKLPTTKREKEGNVTSKKNKKNKGTKQNKQKQQDKVLMLRELTPVKACLSFKMDAAAAVVVKAVGEVEAVVLSGVKYVKKAQPGKKKKINLKLLLTIKINKK